MTQDCSNLKRDKHPMPAVRRAVMRDLPKLIEFTSEEAIEAERSIKAFEILEKGIRAALEDDSKANEMESQNGLELRLYVHRDNKKAIKAYEKSAFKKSSYEIMVLEK